MRCSAPRESLARLDGAAIAAGAKGALDEIRATFSREERIARPDLVDPRV